MVVPAGGEGRRFGGVAKPFALLAGRPLLQHAIGPFLERTDVQSVIVALPGPIAADPPAWLLDYDRRITLVKGGAERFDSVLRGIEAVSESIDIIIVHDAARPLVTAAIVERVLVAARSGGGAIAAIPMVDTVHELNGKGRIVATPPRERLRAAQTPQAFRRAVLVDACRRAVADGLRGTDEAAVVSRYGGDVTAVDGSSDNIKVTVPSDLLVAEALLAARGNT